MKITSLSFAHCLILIVLGCALVLSQVGGDKRPTTTPTPRPTPRRTPRPRSTPRPTPKPKASPTATSTPKTQPANSNATGEAANERTYWESIRSSTDAEDFRAYLKRYPNGVYADLARNRLNALEAAAGEESRRKEEEAKKRPRAGAVVRNQMGMELAYVPAGSFMMGSPASEVGRSNDEGPHHQVTIRDGFYMGRYEVTQAQWQQVMGSNPSSFKAENLPVETVSWNEAQEFIRKLNAMNDGYVYRLPTEAEWEYACRAGTTTPFAFGSTLSSDQANFDGNYPYGGAAKGVFREKTTTVGSFQPNAFGLYDMHGNLWEWCEDWYHDSYNGAPADGSAWLGGGGQYRVLRGGSWDYNANYLRSAYRDRNVPDYRNISLGFRVVAAARTS